MDTPNLYTKRFFFPRCFWSTFGLLSPETQYPTKCYRWDCNPSLERKFQELLLSSPNPNKVFPIHNS